MYVMDGHDVERERQLRMRGASYASHTPAASIYRTVTALHIRASIGCINTRVYS